MKKKGYNKENIKNEQTNINKTENNHIDKAEERKKEITFKEEEKWDKMCLVHQIYNWFLFLYVNSTLLYVNAKIYLHYPAVYSVQHWPNNIVL